MNEMFIKAGLFSTKKTCLLKVYFSKDSEPIFISKSESDDFTILRERPEELALNAKIIYDNNSLDYYLYNNFSKEELLFVLANLRDGLREIV